MRGWHLALSKPGLALRFDDSVTSGVTRRRSWPSERACIAITSVAWSAANGTWPWRTSSNWRGRSRFRQEISSQTSNELLPDALDVSLALVLPFERAEHKLPSTAKACRMPYTPSHAITAQGAACQVSDARYADKHVTLRIWCLNRRRTNHLASDG
jgi:hypothetical protein